tara:strand:+ start:168 stop:338 length:171 start_codon:yes stop_codon:yes gene_type:complete
MKKLILYLCIFIAALSIFNLDTYANGIIPIENIQGFDNTVKQKTVEAETSTNSPID